MRTVRFKEFKAIGFGMIGLVIGLLLIFFWSHDRTGTRPRDEDTCCKEVQVQEKTGVTTTLITSPTKSLIARSEMSSESYCIITSCKTITFSSIFSSDPGQIGSCLSVFQDRCPSPSPGFRRSIDLVFKNARFPSNKLTKSWINLSPSVNLAVESIRLEDCQLDKIEPEAFLSDLFITTRNFQLVNTKLSVLNKSVFKELSNLRNFAVQNNIINAAERYLLSNVAETLETIELDRSIDNLAVLLNITSYSISPSPRPDSNSSLILDNEPTKARQLSNVQLVSLQGNNIPILSKEIFSSFPNLRSLYLDSSKITHINFDTFDACKSLKQIFLTNNLLSTLPDNIFTNLLIANPDFKVTMTNNPWECDCKFIWMQKFLIKAPNLVTEMPKCFGPNRNRNLSFLDADFCGNSSTDTTEIINNDNNNSLIKIICNNSLDLIEINLNKTKLEAMGAEQGNISSGGFNCVCKSILIKKNNNNNGDDDDGWKKNLWLSNEDKAIVLSLYTIVSVLFGLGCAAGCFLIVRNNPSLLQGSSRVVMVKHGGVEAMVLPRGVKVGNLATGSGEPVKFEMRDNCEIDYLTPIGIVANEYESIRDAGGAREESGIDNCPPPLPPHPLHGVRTVSLLMAESESSSSGF